MPVDRRLFDSTSMTTPPEPRVEAVTSTVETVAIGTGPLTPDEEDFLESACQSTAYGFIADSENFLIVAGLLIRGLVKIEDTYDGPEIKGTPEGRKLAWDMRQRKSGQQPSSS
jgi:hypothetical protein